MVSLVMFVFPFAETGLCFPLRTNRKAYRRGLFRRGFIIFAVIPAARTGLGFELKTSRKVYHRGFGQLDCILTVFPEA
jgi:hypothetical protein